MSIKIIQLSLGLLLVAGATSAQSKPFTLEGTIKGKTDGYIYLGTGGRGYDSALIQGGRFQFKGSLSGPVQASVMMDRNGRFFDKYTQLYMVPGKMQLSLDYADFSEGAVLKGSPVQAEADALKKSKAAIMAQMKPLQDAYSKANGVYIEALKAKKDEATLEALKAEATTAKDALYPYQKQLQEIDQAFMDKHPASFVTASMLMYRVSHMPLAEGEARYRKLSNAVKNSALGKMIKQELEELRGGSPGATAFQFASTELRGGELKLSDYKGRYVLVDFWASWCVPCRKGNPHLLNLYAKYKDKGLEIIGVSDDDSNPEAWKKAVEKDGIGVWKHVLRGLKRVDGPQVYDRSASISDKYGISSLPTKVLIDPNGVIIGRYGGGGEDDAAMDKKLAEVFGG
jgi:thiol-disulfide isomerase/thioredoxin